MTHAMPRYAVALVSLLVPSIALAQVDSEGCKDYPGISRMANFYIDQCTLKQFDAASFALGPMDRGEKVSQEGRFFHLEYQQKESTPEASKLQIVRNMQNAAKRAGGQVMADWVGDNWATTALKLTQGGKEVWVQVEARDGSYQLTVVEKQAMEQDVTMDANAMGSALSQTGKVALYGVYFDSGKSDVKPESAPTLGEIAKLLQQRPQLTLFVVGHTDLTGDPASNLRLSQARAQAVIAALTSRHGIAASRLKPFGAGPYAPVASNGTEEGRAKNRRVELVESSAR